MSSEANKALVRRIFELTDKNDWSALSEIFAPDYQLRFPGKIGITDAEDHLRTARAFYKAFPDLDHTIEDQIAEGDRVLTRMTLRGTHRGDFLGVSATGRHVSFEHVSIHRVRGGKIAEQESSVDLWGLMQQLGASTSQSQTL